MGNIKITTKPFSYEIEIIKTSKKVPKKIKEEFLEWLEEQSFNSTLGTNYEYFSYSDNYKDDIEVEFFISIKKEQ